MNNGPDDNEVPFYCVQSTGYEGLEHALSVAIYTKLGMLEQ